MSGTEPPCHSSVIILPQTKLPGFQGPTKGMPMSPGEYTTLRRHCAFERPDARSCPTTYSPGLSAALIRPRSTLASGRMISGCPISSRYSSARLAVTVAPMLGRSSGACGTRQAEVGTIRSRNRTALTLLARDGRSDPLREQQRRRLVFGATPGFEHAGTEASAECQLRRTDLLHRNRQIPAGRRKRSGAPSAAQPDRNLDTRLGRTQ